MSNHYPDPHSRYYQAMVEAAKVRAEQLRQEAINTYWDDTGHQARRALGAVNRMVHGLLHQTRMGLASGAGRAAIHADGLAAARQRSLTCG